ncbi:MAG: hypothetical protein H8E44_30765 [Planctomycetes bacterium]|nr:hypothetical protein [Planctomycetota bacterium]MBL7039991.1 hypothetical protein [Pirellulaceae bacterium]
MKRLLLLLCLIGESCFADEIPVSSSELVGWLEFDKPAVTLQCEVTKPKKGDDYGEWVWAYSNDRHTHHSYRIVLIEGNVLFKGHQKEAERHLEEAANKEAVGDSKRPSWEMGSAVHTRPDGRKVFFGVMRFRRTYVGGFGFTSLCNSKYDLLIDHRCDAKPPDYYPAEPKKALTDVFERIELAVLKYVEEHGEELDPSPTRRPKTNLDQP